MESPNRDRVKQVLNIPLFTKWVISCRNCKGEMGYRLKANHFSSWSRPMKVIFDVPVSRNKYKTVSKELSLCHKFWFSNLYIFGFQRRKPLKFQTMTFVRSKNIKDLRHWVPKILGLKNRVCSKDSIPLYIYIYIYTILYGNRSYSANKKPIWKRR